jgi:hypothetical protein
MTFSVWDVFYLGRFFLGRFVGLFVWGRFVGVPGKQLLGGQHLDIL